MITGRRWLPSTWRERYALHPVNRAFARGMVWGVFDVETDALEAAFHVDTSGDAVDLEDETLELSDSSHRVGVVHPAQLSDRDGWLECFADYELIQSFEQLTRPIYSPQEWLDDEGRWKLKGREPVNPGTFMGRLTRLGYERGPREDAGLISVAWRSTGPWEITLEHTSYSPEWLEGDDVYLEAVRVSRDGEAIEPATLPAHVFSEIAYDIERLTASS